MSRTHKKCYIFVYHLSTARSLDLKLQGILEEVVCKKKNYEDKLKRDWESETFQNKSESYVF